MESKLVFDIPLAPIHIQLYAKNDVEKEGEHEACGDKAVAYLCGCCEKSGQASSNLANDSESGELTRGL